MTKKADFNADEWSTVVEGPLLAGMRVVASTRGGTIRESLAIGRVYQEARQTQGESELLDEIVSSPPALDPQKLQGGGDLAAVSSERLRGAVALVAQKGTAAEVEGYKGFVVTVAQAAAEAHKAGGFAGIGGKPVSDEEQGALDDIRRVLEEGGGAESG